MMHGVLRRITHIKDRDGRLLCGVLTESNIGLTASGGLKVAFSRMSFNRINGWN